MSFTNDELLAQQQALAGFARKLTRNPVDAKDLVQDTYVRALTARESFQTGSNLRAWLFTIMHNAFLSGRRKIRHESVSDSAAEMMSVPGDQEDSIALQEVACAIEALPREQRDAIMFVGVDGLSYEEAAAASGCAVGTMKSRLSRARTRLAT